MYTCVLLFLGIFAFFFGIFSAIFMQASFGVSVGIAVPMCIMTGGFLLAAIILLLIHNELLDADNPESEQMSIAKMSQSLAWLGSIVTCVLQICIRYNCNEWGFFVFGGRSFLNVFTQAGVAGNDGILLCVCMAVSFFAGLFPFVLCYFSADVSRYIIITTTHCSDGFSYESDRSKPYVTVKQFILSGVLCAVITLFCSVTPLIFFVTAIYFGLKFAKSSNKLSKKIFVACIVALVFTILSILPNFGVAYVGDYKALYVLNNDTYQVVGLKNKGPSRTGHLIIESEIDGKKVSVIKKDAFNDEDDILSVYIPKDITIEAGAFDDCDNITSVTVPHLYTTGFENCTSLQTIYIHSATYFKDSPNYFPYATTFYLPKTIERLTVSESSTYNKTFYYEGTIDDWNKILIDGTFGICTIYVMSNGEYVLLENA